MDVIKFEVGQPAYDSFRFKGLRGEVISVGTNYVAVRYPPNEIGTEISYINRKFSKHDAFPTLYPYPYEFEVKEVEQFQKGDLVLWRNNEGHPWNIAKHWGKMQFNNHLVQAFGQFETHAKFVIPFKSNEHKLWKTN